MEKINIDSFISGLLYEHDCVIITDLGGFVANYKPSFLHPAHHTILPPSKKIAFNASLKINDGLLASFIADSMEITYQEACRLIYQYVDDSLNLLNTGKKLHIDKIGSLFYNAEKKLQFSPDFSTNYLLDSFGLSPVHFPALKREVPVKKMQTRLPEPSVEVRAGSVKKSHFSWRWVELIPAAAVLVLLLLNPMVIKNLNSNVAGLFPEMHLSNPLETIHNIPDPPPAVPGNTMNLTADSSAADLNTTEFSTEKNSGSADTALLNTNNVSTGNSVNLNEPVKVDSDKSESGKTENTVKTNVPGFPFYIVAGCFRIEENAQKLYNDLLSKGYAAEMIGKYKGLHVVTFQHASSSSEARDAIDRLKKQDIEAWVLKK